MENDKSKKVIRILWAVCIIPVLIGIIIVAVQTETTKYSTDEYWVAQGYHHVYERYSGEIVDYIEDDETCTIKGDEIIVKKQGKGCVVGWCLIAFFGLGVLGCIWGTVSTSDWWLNRFGA